MSAHSNPAAVSAHARNPDIPDVEQWRALVDKVLKGADFERVLVGRTADAIAIDPLYAKASGAPRAMRAASGRWAVCQPVDHPDGAEANRLALADLTGGTDTLALVFQGARTARGFGLPVTAIAAALGGVHLDLIRLRAEPPPFAGQAVFAALSAVLAPRGLDAGALAIDWGVDPIGDMASTGTAPKPWLELAAEAAALVASVRAAGFTGAVLRADGRVHHEAGATEAQELAAALGSGVAYLRALEASGMPLDEARRAISFTLVADADEFLTVAKLRALRRLWAEVEVASGLAPEPIQLAAETAWRMTTRHDPFVNMLRNTMAVFSAAVGGADVITVLPHTAPLGLADDFARRMARNTQIILAEESNIWRVADPAAGAGGFETLTAELCDKAWALFQRIEGEGGLAAMLASGTWQAEVATAREARVKAIARRKQPLTGTTAFPNLDETPVTVLMPAVEPEAAATMDFLAMQAARVSEPIERLRDHVMARGYTVFLATLGKPADFAARAGFARGVFETGGLRTTGSEGFASYEALIAAYRSSGAHAACICSSDDRYDSLAADAAVAGETLAEEAARGLAAAGCDLVMLAGAGGTREAARREAGVTDFLVAGMDIVDFLAKTIARLDAQDAGTVTEGGL
ncbi:MULTISPECIES: methylmalonyl-CoA mutase subunit beta [unclassified Chelatococcus]|uniref:methylmalonyl-CoA mutase subunit beta n=1 Tax=unclassified Chelatococcus TaxID=2638111 RepID=UPI001BCA8F60|nr:MULTISPECIES: methylmalonyl-CoA mutase subunit beta [unclassified Chelatococcus]MBS7697684.1 methylmalonyl-CoA mutase subunit beta [Chelatococcus sp. YT9]MBX3558459.1 methylmalonyl-CoA mutase subunit beta [Chelatococcus sp.]